MKQNTVEQAGKLEATISTGAVGSRKSFTIAANANIFDILSNKIYERPIEAIVRELYSNAIDANIEAGRKGGLRVQLPTAETPILTISDQGIGMSAQKVDEVFTQYGNSTKSADNTMIGGFGIGCKTPFAYTNQFTVETVYNGMKETYVAMKDENGPSILHAASVPAKDATTGTTVKIPVKKCDVIDFVQAAKKVFFFAKEFPIIEDENGGFKAFKDSVAYSMDGYVDSEAAFAAYMKRREEVQNGAISADLRFLGSGFSSGVVALIGGVVYTVDNSYLPNGQSCPHLERSMIINIPIGEVSVQASREKLNYDARTQEKIVAYFNATMIKLANNLLETATSEELTPVQKHRILRDWRIHDIQNYVNEIASQGFSVEIEDDVA